MTFQTCRICNGLSKTKCIFCGQKMKQKKDMTEMEKIQADCHKERMDWLRKMYNQLRTHKMTTTGDPDLDEQIKQEIGIWSW